MSSSAEYEYIYPWKNNEKRARLYGKPFRIICRGSLNSVLVEFSDVERIVTSANATSKRSTMSGKIVFYTGPMGGGKTKCLLDEVATALATQKKSIAFKYSVADNKRAVLDMIGLKMPTWTIESRSGDFTQCVLVETVEEMRVCINHISHMLSIDVVAIDEISLFADDDIDDMVDLCITLRNGGVRVVLAGFDNWYNGERTPVYKAISNVADSVVFCYPRCEECGESLATLSARIGGGNDLVETDAQYKAVCLPCWRELTGKR